MRRLSFLTLVLFFLSFVSLLGVDSQIEFTGEVVAIDAETDPAVLTLRLTPAFTIPVQVTELTEIRDEDGESIQLSDLQIGQRLEVEGLFTSQGILAIEISISTDVSEFEIRGIIERVAEDRVIQVNGFSIQVPESAVIKDQFGNVLAFSELAVGQRVKVEGMTVDGALVAREVVVRTPRDDFAAVRFRGIIAEVLGPEAFIVRLEGDVPVQVVLTPETKIRGELAVGVLVRVVGRLRPDLAVEARSVTVERLLQLAPPRLRLRPDQQHSVVAILRSPLDQDVELSVTSRDPDVADAMPMTLVIPAGRLTGSFQVLAGNQAGETVIDVAMPAALGGLSVELPVTVRDRDNEEEEEEELEVHWQPDRLSASPPGQHQVRLQLNRPAPTDVVVALSLREGPGDQLEFPAEVMIPRGERATLVAITIHSVQVKATIRATLPADLGGDSDDLEITPPREPQRLKISWEPEEVETSVGSEFRVSLQLDRAAPEDLTAFVRPQGGDQAGKVSGVPSEVRFAAGQREAEMVMTAEAAGKVRLRASLPLRLGGRHADLKIEVRR